MQQTQNEIDLLMELDPLELSEQNLSDIIAYHRKRRADFEAGVRPKKEKGQSLDNVLQALQAAVPKAKVDRRF